jgi:DMSO/TMAO reductase YedYZ molybdopterin-dependent catalytic subunit
LPHRYGWKSAKWISEIEFLTQEVLGFWEQRGYHRRGDFWLAERFSGD